jgi:hypothetical protein
VQWQDTGSSVLPLQEEAGTVKPSIPSCLGAAETCLLIAQYINGNGKLHNRDYRSIKYGGKDPSKVLVPIL